MEPAPHTVRVVSDWSSLRHLSLLSVSGAKVFELPNTLAVGGGVQDYLGYVSVLREAKWGASSVRE